MMMNNNNCSPEAQNGHVSSSSQKGSRAHSTTDGDQLDRATESSRNGVTTTETNEKESSSGSSRVGRLNRFADYFVICGLDLDTGLEPDRFSGDNLHCSPLDRNYKSKALAHYPENVPYNPFDSHGICMLSLPAGLKFRTQKHSIEPKFHAFATTREDGKRCYGFSLVFYEEVRNRNICSAMHTLQSMFITELSSRQNGPAVQRVREQLQTPASRSLPRHFKLAAHTPATALSYYDITKDKLYVAKSITLVCQQAYAAAAEIFLRNIYKCLPRQPGPGLSLESYVYNILYEVIIPQPGKSIRIYLPPDESHLPPIQFLLQRPDLTTELPLLDFPFRTVFSLLGIEQVLQLFTCMLLENQVLLRSADYHQLMVVGEAITALLFPFTWQHVYAPILPASLYHFLDAPVPFVMGLHADAETNIKIGTEATLCYVDIDKKALQLPEELPVFPHRNEFVKEIAALLDKYKVPRDKTMDQVPTIFGGGAGGSAKSGRGMSDAMTASCTLPSGSHIRRKHSINDMLDWDQRSGGSPEPLLPQQSSPTPVRSDAMQKMMGIIRKTGVNIDEVDLAGDVMPNQVRRSPRTAQEQYEDDLRFNNAVRELFLNRFVQMFNAYEHFVIMPNQDREEWLSNRESLQNFDKASYLSDQPQHHRPFLSQFLETQMFATLIDNKIQSVWERPDYDTNLNLFDQRIKLLRRRYGGESMIRPSSYEPCLLGRESLCLLEKRLALVDMEVTPPSEILPNRPAYFRSFPLLDKSCLNQESASRGNSLRRVKTGNKWKVKDISIEGTEKKVDQQPLNLNQTADASPALLAQQNWSFVEKLLRDCKIKTKRMLLEKMGTEVGGELGGEVTVMGVEENTLIASLCDLLEKIWSHGMQNKQGKSALWSHLQSYLEIQECTNTSKPIDNNYLTPVVVIPSRKAGRAGRLAKSAAYNVPVKTEEMYQDTSPTSPFEQLFILPMRNVFGGGSGSGNRKSASPTSSYFKFSSTLSNDVRKRLQFGNDLNSYAIEPESPPSPTRSRSKSRDRKSLGPDQLRPLPESLDADIKNILAMTDVKTHIGYARAFVRLALEKKLLSRHLRTLLADTGLSRSLYKRSAFLRCDEERDQFLFHLLTLNAVDYFCFTNTYPTTKLPYRVVIFPSRKNGTLISANVWVSISGSLCETNPVYIPRNSLEFLFHHKNLGLLTSLRIGHDSGVAKWMVEHVVVRNEVTGHTYKFPCGRWLGRGIDDGSIERLLVGQLVARTVDNEDLVEACKTPPPRARSPSVHRPEMKASEIQHMVGDCVNAIVKWHYRPSRERDTHSLTNLLCGEEGLVKSLENAFLCGFRSARLFGKNLYIWDYFLKVKEHFELSLSEELSVENGTMTTSTLMSDSMTSSQYVTPSARQEMMTIWRSYCHLMDEISNVTQTMGKDGKFQLFVCLSLREHLLHRILIPMANSKVTLEMYEEESFLRKKGLLTFLRQILEPLDEIHIVLENSLTQGIASHC